MLEDERWGDAVKWKTVTWADNAELSAGDFIRLVSILSVSREEWQLVWIQGKVMVVAVVVRGKEESHY